MCKNVHKLFICFMIVLIFVDISLALNDWFLLFRLLFGFMLLNSQWIVYSSSPFKAAVAKSISWTAVRRCNLYARIFRWSPHANFGRLMLEYWGFVVVAVKNVNASAEICMQWWKANWDTVKAQQISWKNFEILLN